MNIIIRFRVSIEKKTIFSHVGLFVSHTEWKHHFVKFSLASPTLSWNSWNTVASYGQKCSRSIGISADVLEGTFSKINLLPVLSSFASIVTCPPRVLLASIVEYLSRNLSMYLKICSFLEHAHQRIFFWIYEHVLIFNKKNNTFSGKNSIVICTGVLISP